MLLFELMLKYGELKTLTQGTLGNSLYNAIATSKSSKELNSYLTHKLTGFTFGKPTHHPKGHFTVYNLLEGRLCASNLTTNPKSMPINFILEAHSVYKPNSLLKPIVVDYDLYRPRWEEPNLLTKFNEPTNPLLKYLDPIKSMHNIHVVEGAYYNSSTTYYSIDGVTSIKYSDLLKTHFDKTLTSNTELSWSEIDANMSLVEEAHFIINKSNKSNAEKVLMSKNVSILNSAPQILVKSQRIAIAKSGALHIIY